MSMGQKGAEEYEEGMARGKEVSINSHLFLAAAVRRQWRARRVVGVGTAAVATP